MAGARAAVHAGALAAALSLARLASLAAALAVAGTVLQAAAGVDTSDEMWFLQVAARVADGEALYRDVFFGSTPLAVWLTVPGVALAGAEVMVVKALVAASVAVLAAALARGAEQAGLSARAAVLLACAFALFAARLTLSPYVCVAMAAAGWAVVAAVAWRGTGLRWQLLAAGALAGAAVASKYTIGFLAIGAVALVVLDRRPRAWRPALAAAGACAAVVLLALLPVAVTGGVPRFVEYGFTAKGTYVSAGAVTYPGALGGAFGNLEAALRSPSAGTLEDATRAVPALLPLLAALLLAGAWRRLPAAPLLALCTLAAVAGAYPRFSTRHLAAALPASLLAVAVAAAVLAPRGSRLRPVLLAATGLWIAANVAGGLAPKSADATLAGEPHLRGVRVAQADLDGWRADAAALRAAGAEGPLLVVSAESALLHLLAGVPNPTPFGYPYVTAFGRDGEAGTAARVRAGAIPAVCVDPEIPAHFVPRRLVAAVAETLPRVADLNACRLHGSNPNLATTLSRLR